MEGGCGSSFFGSKLGTPGLLVLHTGQSWCNESQTVLSYLKWNKRQANNLLKPEKANCSRVWKPKDNRWIFSAVLRWGRADMGGPLRKLHVCSPGRAGCSSGLKNDPSWRGHKRTPEGEGLEILTLSSSALRSREEPRQHLWLVQGFATRSSQQWTYLCLVWTAYHGMVLQVFMNSPESCWILRSFHLNGGLV